MKTYKIKKIESMKSLMIDYKMIGQIKGGDSDPGVTLLQVDFAVKKK
jgi:hypothetical protein